MPEDDTVLLLRACFECRKEQVFRLDRNKFKSWKAGSLIQNCFPKLSPDDREFIISGICGPCFDKVFGEEPTGEAENAPHN